MALTDAPEVRIDTTILAPAWSLTAPIALGGLAITWGRRTHLDDAEPASLVFEMIDTDGQLGSTATLIGKRVSVRRADDGKVIFRGRIDDYTVDQVLMADPATNRERRVWLFKITAYDNLAELAKSNAAGPDNGVYPVNTVAGRIDDLEDAAAEIVDGITWSDPWPGTKYAYPSGAGRSLLQRIEAVYNILPLAYVRHDPSTNIISPGRPASTLGVELTWDGDTLDVELADGVTIPAREIAMPNGYRVGSGQQDAVDVVRVESLGEQFSAQDGLSVDWVITEGFTAHYDQAARGRREFTRTNDVVYNVVTPTLSSFDWPFDLKWVVSEYGYRNAGFHEGIDFSGGPAVSGGDIHAAGSGEIVTNVTLHPGWGNYVVIDHGQDLKTLYAHMITPSPLPVGTMVNRGDTLGQVGSTGNSTGPHLHFETWVSGDHVNPRNFMSQYGQPETPPDPDAGTWQRESVDETIALLDQLTGKLPMPSIRFDWRLLNYTTAVTARFLAATAQDVAIYFPGSVFGVIGEASPEHQVIGGRLVYHKGWTLDANLAPAIRTRAGITVAQLVTIDAPTISDFDDDLTLADLGNVTKGVTA